MVTSTEDILKKRAESDDMISGGHLVAKALKNEGVDAIFTLCGGHIIDIYDGCIEEGIKIFDFRHEQTAAHAADGYARQTGNLGCLRALSLWWENFPHKDWSPSSYVPIPKWQPLLPYHDALQFPVNAKYHQYQKSISFIVHL